ncbi:hypothetical protein HanIR_Chr10g0455781 [Helianthus annuus]|nr:hypothetical protein HanIR_Chr10g0455781 [Helianthus annuus]
MKETSLSSLNQPFSPLPLSLSLSIFFSSFFLFCLSHNLVRCWWFETGSAVLWWRLICGGLWWRLFVG